ncbi:MAG: hypothetical protein WCO26_20070, partial [Deltaproteobacteria bacterium]
KEKKGKQHDPSLLEILMSLLRQTMKAAKNSLTLWRPSIVAALEISCHGMGSSRNCCQKLM